MIDDEYVCMICRYLHGIGLTCPARTVGGCVWTKEDLERDPSAWERREDPVKHATWCVAE